MGYIIFVLMVILECFPIEKYSFDFGVWFWIIISLIAVIEMGNRANKL